MQRSTVKKILALLKKAKVEIDDDTLDGVTEALDEFEVSTDESVGADKMVVARSDWQDVNKDLLGWKKKFRDEEANHNDLKESVDAGDSDNVRKLRLAQEQIATQKPLLDGYMETVKTAWAEAKDSIPDNLKPFFVFPEKDGELTEAQLIANHGKIVEYTKIGAIKAGEPGEEKPPKPTPLGAPKTPPGGKPPPKSQEGVDDSDEAMEKSYTYQPPAARA